MRGEFVQATDLVIRSAEVRAAGGVVLVRGGDRTELLLVHRPRYDDVTLPKGKLDGGEGFEQAALREVREETGFTCELVRLLGATRYEDRKGRLKVVVWWQMAPVEAAARPADDEVDEVLLVPIVQAPGRLTYELDRDVLAAALI